MFGIVLQFTFNSNIIIVYDGFKRNTITLISDHSTYLGLGVSRSILSLFHCNKPKGTGQKGENAPAKYVLQLKFLKFCH